MNNKEPHAHLQPSVHPYSEDRTLGGIGPLG